jgi:cytoskeletal protein RodZ
MAASAETVNAQRMELGRLLQEAREERGLTLADVEAATRIRAKYLAAFESGDYGLLPGGVTTRGFFRNYATFLGLDPYELANRFRHALPPPAPGSNYVPLETMPTWQTEQRAVSVTLDEGPSFPFLLVLLGILLVGGVVAGGWYLYQRNPGFLNALLPPPTATPTLTVPPTATSRPPTATRPAQPTPAATLPPSPTALSNVLPLPTPTPTPRPTDTATPTPTPQVFKSIALTVRVTARAWLRATADNRVVFEGLLEKDQEQTWEAKERMRLDLGNAGGVIVILNGTERGTLGLSGEVVRREWVLIDGAIAEYDLAATATAEAAPAVSPILEPGRQ